MINKSKLWFLTLSSIILVLSLFYVLVPNENGSLVFSEKDSKDDITIEESEVLTAMKVTNEEENLEETKKIQEVLLNNEATIDEKNDAYNKLKYINNNKTIENKIEKYISDKYNISSFIKIKENNIKVTIINKEKSYELANSLIKSINSDLKYDYYVTIEFK